MTPFIWPPHPQVWADLWPLQWESSRSQGAGHTDGHRFIHHTRLEENVLLPTQGVIYNRTLSTQPSLCPARRADPWLVIRSRLGEDFLWEALQVLSQADCLSLCLPISLPCWLPSRWLTASTRPQTLRLLHLFGPVSHPQHPAQHQCVYRHTRIFFHYRKLTTRVEFPAAQNQTVLTGGTFKSNDEASIVFSKASPSTWKRKPKITLWRPRCGCQDLRLTSFQAAYMSASFRAPLTVCKSAAGPLVYHLPPGLGATSASDRLADGRCSAGSGSEQTRSSPRQFPGTGGQRAPPRESPKQIRNTKTFTLLRFHAVGILLTVTNKRAISS